MPPPHRYSYEAFSRYAPDLGEALDIFPKVLKVEVTGSLETYAARFRDARKAKTLYSYTHPAIDETKFANHADSLSVAMRDGYVLIGLPSAIRTYELQPEVRRQAPETIEVSLSDYDCATYLCELIKHKAFKTTIAFTVGPLSQEQATKLETDYGVTIVPVEGQPGIFTLL